MSKQTTQIPENENPKLKSTFQIRQPNKKNSSSRWNTNSIRNWNPNHKIKTKKKIIKRSKEIRIEPAKRCCNSKCCRNFRDRSSARLQGTGLRELSRASSPQHPWERVAKTERWLFLCCFLRKKCVYIYLSQNSQIFQLGCVSTQRFTLHRRLVEMSFVFVFF